MCNLTSLDDADLAHDLCAADAELARLREAYAKLGDDIVALDARADALRCEQSRRRIAASPQPDWAFLLQGDQDSARYRESARQLERLGLHQSGYFPETMQCCIGIALTRAGGEQEIGAVAAALAQVLPVLKAVPSLNAKVLRIRESTLSEHGQYHLHVEEEGAVSVRRLRYGRSTELYRDAALENALRFIQTNLFYA